MKKILLVIAMVLLSYNSVSMVRMVEITDTAIMLHKLNVDDPVWLANVIEYESRKKNIPPRLIVALIHTESSFDKYAVSRLSYHGLMQVKPRVFDERKNIQIGCEILKEKLIKANGDIFKALHYYKGYRIGSKRGKIAVNKTLAIYHRGRI